jgi:hypothetical protein
MSVLHSMVSFQLGWLILALAVILGASLLVLWISTFLGRRWYVTIRRSEETELMNIYLSRIAESLERLAGTPGARIDFSEARAPQFGPASGGNAHKSASMSMLGL